MDPLLKFAKKFLETKQRAYAPSLYSQLNNNHMCEDSQESYEVTNHLEVAKQQLPPQPS